MRVMSDMPAAGSVKVVVSAALSERFEKRYVVVDEATGDIVDDAGGYGYKTAQNARRARAYKSMAPKNKRQRDAAKRGVRRWCAAHPEFMGHVESAMFYALKDGRNLTEADVGAMPDEHGVELPFSVKDLMRHWNW
jgi:tagatose-1,6-bisphosphate aldolase non-catalytic subunit AgaZ/GatZ